MNQWGMICIILIVLFLSPFSVSGQGEFNNWYFGYKAGVTFNSGSPGIILNGQMDAYRTSVSVSDSLGNLLFYSNGESVWNKNHQVMPNGSGLHANINCDQTVGVIRKIEDDSSYYLFTMMNTYWPFSPYNGLHYSVINMRLNGGLGDIENGSKEIPLQTMYDVPMLMATVRHHNNKDAWVIVRNMFNANNFSAFLITSSGISTTPVISQSSSPANELSYCNPGTMRVSPDGNKLVCPYQDTVEFCGFNSGNGQITPLFLFKTGPKLFNTGWHYMEFSLDSKYLYCSTGDWPWTSSNIYQYDASKTDSALFKQSEILVGYRNRGVHLQRGPDGKIYGGEAGKDSLSVIQNPDQQGIACNYQPHIISLSGRQCTQGMPDLLQRYYIFINAQGKCEHIPVLFNPVIWPPADTIRWNFGDPSSGSANVSNLTNPIHVFSNAGTYTVELYVRHNDNRTDTTWKNITIYPSPSPTITGNISPCVGVTEVYQTQPGFSDYQWTHTGTLISGGTAGDNSITIQWNSPGSQSVGVNYRNSQGCYAQLPFSLPVSVAQISTVSITINTPLTNVCSGTAASFTATPINPGTNPVYIWKVNDVATGPNIPVFTYIPANNDVITCVLNSDVSCPVGNPAVSNAIALTVNPLAPVSVSISPAVNPVCEGIPVTFNATPVNPGLSPAYQWKVNGLNVGSNSNTYSYVPLNGDVVNCILTSSLTTCVTSNPATSNPVTMTVNPVLPVSVSIAASATSVCSGASVTLTATPVNPGSSPVYQWKVNGGNAGTNALSYSYVPLNGDVISCVLTSSLTTCVTSNPATSNPVIITVNPLLPVSVSITASANPVCSGSPITFNATALNQGSVPVYQWKVNGLNMGTNSSTYSYVPVNGDIVQCTLTSSEPCAINNPASCIPFPVSVKPLPQVTYSSCYDTITTITAQPIKLKGGVPVGGTYSGPGVNSITGYFNPSAAGVGVKTISYSYQNIYSCSDSKNRTITVQPSPSFTCGGLLTDLRDGKTYPTVLLGTQCWMQKNLDYGSAISAVNHQKDNCLAEKYCYNDIASNCSLYGGLYQWDEMMQFMDTPAQQGLCPAGWHIPTQAEWLVLFNYYQGQGLAGKPMQDSIISGFKALENGVNYSNASWNFKGFASIFWTSTPSGSIKAVSHGMNLINFSVSDYYSNRSNAFGVRCVRD